jgi:hypothetical protein
MIKSADAEVRALIEALGSGDEARREAAVARLIIIGERAVARLLGAFGSTADSEVQVAVLRVLEVTGDERALTVARAAIAMGGDRAVAGVTVLGALLERGRLSSETDALEALLGVLEDAAAERRLRLAAAQALARMPGLGAAIAGTLPPQVSADQALWEDAVEGRLPDDPRALRSAVAQFAPGAPLPLLRRLIEGVRGREEAIAAASGAAIRRRDEWRAARGALHQVLALRGSRIALYDLRETIERAAEPLPQSFLAAMQVLGDASCLEPLAAAHAHAPEDDQWWRHQLARSFRAVAKRERLTTRHSALRRALARSPELAQL